VWIKDKAVSKQALRDSHNAKDLMDRKKANQPTKKLRTIAGRLIRELRRKLSSGKLAAHELSLLLYERSHHTATYRQKQDLPAYTNHSLPVLPKVKGIRLMSLAIR
jgi:hypothetical protein